MSIREKNKASNDFKRQKADWNQRDERASKRRNEKSEDLTVTGGWPTETIGKSMENFIL